MKKATKTKKPTFVAATTGPELADVHWKGGGLAVTQMVGRHFSITHLNTGQSIINSVTRTMILADVVKVARLLVPLFNWKAMGYADGIARREQMNKRITAALKKAGMLP